MIMAVEPSDARPTRSQCRASRRLMRAANQAALATLLPEREGFPYASLVSVATDHDGSPILLLSTLADHTRNLLADPRLSLMFEDPGEYPNPQQRPRVSVLGRAERTDRPRHRARFLAHHPAAVMYADFKDFSFYRVEVERAHFVGGFARAAWIGSILLAAAAAADRMAEAEAGLLAAMNGEHADLTRKLAEKLCLSAEDGAWTMTGVDADGCDLRRGDRWARVAFESPVGGPEEAIEAMTGLAEGTREASEHQA